MTPQEEFDKAAQLAETTLSRYPVEDVELPGAFTDLLDSLRFTLLRAGAGVNAARMARNIAAAMKVLQATRSLSSTGEEKRQFANALLVLQAEYMDARNKALQANAPRYVITQVLRDQAQALTIAYNKVKANAAAMAQVADALGGLTSLLRAIA